MPSDPVKAGRKGGSRNTPLQQAARRKNGFQRKVSPQDEPQISTQTSNTICTRNQSTVLVVEK